MQPGHEVMRRIRDVSSEQYLDMSADAPTFDVPEEMASDSDVAFLNRVQRRLYFFTDGGHEAFVDAPELKRLDQRRHGERCLVTSGHTDEQGRTLYWICEVER